MSEAVVIRPAISADIPALACLFGKDWQPCGLEKMLNTGRGRVLAAHSADGALVGVCSGLMATRVAEDGPAVLIEDVVVREDWRGQGIGARLMDGLKVWAQENEVGRLQLLGERETPSQMFR